MFNIYFYLSVDVGDGRNDSPGQYDFANLNFQDKYYLVSCWNIWLSGFNATKFMLFRMRNCV
jgi:hypothetical protein